MVIPAAIITMAMAIMFLGMIIERMFFLQKVDLHRVEIGKGSANVGGDSSSEFVSQKLKIVKINEAGDLIGNRSSERLTINSPGK